MEDKVYGVIVSLDCFSNIGEMKRDGDKYIQNQISIPANSLFDCNGIRWFKLKLKEKTKDPNQEYEFDNKDIRFLYVFKTLEDANLFLGGLQVAAMVNQQQTKFYPNYKNE